MRDIIGKKIWMLTAVRMVGRHRKYGRKWLWKCECGEETEGYYARVSQGSKKSCGCKRQDRRPPERGVPRGPVRIHNDPTGSTINGWKVLGRTHNSQYRVECPVGHQKVLRKAYLSKLDECAQCTGKRRSGPKRKAFVGFREGDFTIIGGPYYVSKKNKWDWQCGFGHKWTTYHAHINRVGGKCPQCKKTGLHLIKPVPLKHEKHGLLMSTKTHGIWACYCGNRVVKSAEEVRADPFPSCGCAKWWGKPVYWTNAFQKEEAE